MAIDLTVDARLEFSVDVPGSRTVTGSLTGSGKTLELRVSDPVLFAGRSDAAAVRGLAAGLARHGVRVAVVAPAGPLVTLGVRRSSWLQRRLTGSRHMRVEGGAGLWALARGRSRAPRGGALPTAALVPPGTLFPVLPTFRRRPRPSPTTTHDPRGGGDPRLIMAPAEHPLPGDRQEVHRLRDDVTTIGSGAACDIRLPGLEDLHAEVRHDAADEFVLLRLSPPGTTRSTERRWTARCSARRRGSPSVRGRCRSTVRSTPTTVARTVVASAVSWAASVHNRHARGRYGPSTTGTPRSPRDRLRTRPGGGRLRLRRSPAVHRARGGRSRRPSHDPATRRVRRRGDGRVR